MEDFASSLRSNSYQHCENCRTADRFDILPLAMPVAEASSGHSVDMVLVAAEAVDGDEEHFASAAVVVVASAVVDEHAHSAAVVAGSEIVAADVGAVGSPVVVPQIDADFEARWRAGLSPQPVVRIASVQDLPWPSFANKGSLGGWEVAGFHWQKIHQAASPHTAWTADQSHFVSGQQLLQPPRQPLTRMVEAEHWRNQQARLSHVFSWRFSVMAKHSGLMGNRAGRMPRITSFAAVPSTFAGTVSSDLQLVSACHRWQS